MKCTTFLTGLLTAAALAAGLARAADDDVGAAAKGNREFALDLYAKLRTQDGNLFFSPYSISTALAMTRAGARGDTAAEMDKMLHFTLGQDKLNPAFAALVQGDQRRPERQEARLPAQHRQRPVGTEGVRLSRRLPQDRQATTTAAASTTWTSRAHGAGPPDHQRLGREGDAGQDQGPPPERRRWTATRVSC